MAQPDLLKRLLDAGIAFTDMSQKKAERIVRELVKTGELRTKEAQTRVEELMERSRKNTEALVEMIRNEVRSQLSGFGMPGVTKPSRAAAVKKTPAKKAAPVKKAAKKAPAKATKKAAEKTPATKATSPLSSTSSFVPPSPSPPSPPAPPSPPSPV